MPLPGLLLGALLLAAAPGPAPLGPPERTGRVIYHQGTSPSGGAINALVAGTSLPGEQVTCVGCHGDDGLGRPEGGVTPTAISWRELTKPWGRTLPDGRRHPAYDPKTLARAITDGVDSGGNPLGEVMPRYSMSRADLEALVAYLKRLGDEPVPGVGGAELRIGTVLPVKGPFAEMGRAIRGTLEAWAAEVNQAGGINGRKIALHVAGYDPAREGGLDSARALLARRDLLALVSGFTPTAEPALADLAEAQGVPLVGPFTPWPAAEGSGRALTFYLLGGPGEQARVLAAHAIRAGGPAGAALVLHAADERHAAAATAAAERFRAGGWKADLVPLERDRLDAAALAGLRDRGAGWVLFLGDDARLSSFLAQASALGWIPQVLASGALSPRAGLSAPEAFQGRITLAMPSAPEDESPAGREALERAARRAGSGTRFHSVRASAWGAAQVLAEGLRRAGRGLSRERLAASLEGLYLFESGVLPPISYGPSRRIGAAGAWLVTVDPSARGFRPLAGWTPVD